MTTPRMNARLLRRIQKQILKEPRQFQMEAFTTTLLQTGGTIPNCGTAACIYGWGVALKRKWTPLQVRRFNGRHSVERAGDIFGIYNDAAQRLIWFHNWPEKFRKVTEKKEGTAAFARQAVRRIDHFIKTRGEE